MWDILCVFEMLFVILLYLFPLLLINFIFGTTICKINTAATQSDLLCNVVLLNTAGSKCSLEKGMCSWSNTQNSKVDQMDWELTSAETEKHYTTPLHDHTLGTEKGKQRDTSRRTQYHNMKSKTSHLPLSVCQVTSFSSQAAIEQQPIKKLSC